MSSIDPRRAPSRVDTLDSDAHDPHPARSAWLAWLGALGVLICYTMPMLVLDPIAADLDAGATAQIWLISAVNLGLGVGLLPAGTLADNRGRKRVFVAGLGMVAAGTLACGIAGSSVVFVAGRVVQGLGGAAVLSTSLAVIAHAYRGDHAGRVRATAVWGAMLAAGIAVSPLLMGLIAQYADWRLAYWGLVAPLVALTLGSAAWLRESRADAPRPVHLPGVVLAAVAVGTLIALFSLRGGAWTGALPVVLGVLGVGSTVAFVAVQRTTPHPLLPLELFRSRPFLGSLTTAWMTGMASIALLSYLPTMLAAGFHLDVLAAALYFLDWAGVAAVTSAVVPRLVGRASARAQVTVGLTGIALGHGLLVLTGSGDSPAWLLLGLSVAGVGVGVTNANVGRMAVETAPEGRSALGSSMANTARYLGSAVGLPMVVALATMGGAVAGLHYAALATAALALLGAVLVAALTERPVKRSG